jgi:hypothetical protein
MSTNTATLAAAETDSPRAWVGCLGCYNDGSLIGKWVVGLVAADLVAAGLATIETVCGYTTARCIRCFCDEFHVFDYENFGPFLEGECDPWEAQEAAEAIVAFNEAIKNSSVRLLFSPSVLGCQSCTGRLENLIVFANSEMYEECSQLDCKGYPAGLDPKNIVLLTIY